MLKLFIRPRYNRGLLSTSKDTKVRLSSHPLMTALPHFLLLPAAHYVTRHSEMNGLRRSLRSILRNKRLFPGVQIT